MIPGTKVAGVSFRGYELNVNFAWVAELVDFGQLGGLAQPASRTWIFWLLLLNNLLAGRYPEATDTFRRTAATAWLSGVSRPMASSPLEALSIKVGRMGLNLPIANPV